MQSFKYVARDANGKIFRGVVQTESRDAAFRKLKDGGLYSLKLEEIGEDAHRPQRVRLKEVAFFCRQMGTMLAAGVTVLKAIDILCSRADRPKTRKAYLRLYEDIQKGLSLTEAFKEQEGVFPPLLVNMVQAGELSGLARPGDGADGRAYEKENASSTRCAAASSTRCCSSRLCRRRDRLFVFVLRAFSRCSRAPRCRPSPGASWP